MVRIFLGIILLFLSNDVIGKEESVSVPERLFRMTGSETHVSQGDLLYKSQAAGYFSGGGGVVVRSPIKSTNFATASIPEIRSGCGGIDIYTGGFSFVSGKQLTETLQAIASNAGGYAFMLGMETISPQMTNTVRQMQSWANAINGIGINSCEAAARLVGSAWPADEMASEHICRSIGTSNRLYSDYVEGRHQCGKKNNDQSKEVQQLNPLSGEYNIVWKALTSLPFFTNQNLDLAEMYMTLVGTIVVKKNGKGHMEAIPYSPKAEDPDFLQRLLEGGQITKYECADDKVQCLTLLEKEKSLSPETAWLAKIRSTLSSMQIKAITDEPLDSDEKGLLATTRLPLYKFVNVITAYRRGTACPLDLQSIADIVAWDVLAQVIHEAIETVRRGCIQLRTTSAYTTKIDDYLKDLDRVRKIVQRYEERTQKTLDLEMRLIQKMQLLEQQVNSEIILQ